MRLSVVGVLQVRGPVVPGNHDGTFVRNGAAHRRRQRQRAAGSGGVSAQGSGQ